MRSIAAALALLLLAITGVAVAGETVTITLPPDGVTLKPGAGMEQAAVSCRLCHSLDYITTQPAGGAAQWHGVVTKMLKIYGAPIAEPDAKAIAEYLASQYGTR